MKVSRPVKLQINSTGAWRDVVRFDAGDDEVCAEVLIAAAALGAACKATFRICIADEGGRSPTVLTAWTPEHGWKDR